MQVGDETGHIMSLDLRPSDAINLAVRANVPIQVNKALAVADGVRQVSMVPRGAGARSIRAVRSYHFNFTAEDRSVLLSPARPSLRMGYAQHCSWKAHQAHLLLRPT